MFDVVIHFGAPKTGSSAIQYFLMRNNDRLEKLGFYYPPHGYDRNLVSAGHSELGSKLIQGDPDEAEKIFKEYLRISKEKNKCLLLSSESFYGHESTFKKLCKNLRVLAIGFYRDPLECLFSNYNQLVKRHSATFSIEDYCLGIYNESTQDFALELRNICGNRHLCWIEEFGEKNVKILPYYTDFFSEKKIEEFFLEALGLPRGNIEKNDFSYPNKNINISYTQSAIELKRMINGVIDSDLNISKELDLCLQKFSEKNREGKLSLSDVIPGSLYNKLEEKIYRLSEDLVSHIKNNNADFEGFPKSDKTCRLPFPIKGKFSSSYVANEAFKENQEIINYIFRCINKKSKDNSSNENVLKLCTGLGIQNNKIDFKSNSISSETLTSEGYLDLVERGKFSGWARLLGSSTHAIVEIYVDEEKLGEVTANIYRSDLYDAFNSNCAFDFIIDSSVRIYENSIVRAFIKETGRELENSGRRINADTHP